MKTKRPQFIVIDGCEGSGKSTQVENLKKKYPEAVFFREPGGTEFGEEEMRRLILKSKYSTDLSPFEHMSLFFAGRSDNIRRIVAPALAAGKTVFSDRYDSSSFAYQIFGMEGKHLFDHFHSNRLSMGPIEYLPTLYIILDISPEEGMKRTAERSRRKGDFNHFDARGPEFHARAREGYKRFADLYSTRVKLVDAHLSKEEVWDSIQEILLPILG